MQNPIFGLVVSTFFCCGPVAAGVISGVVESGSGGPTSGALVLVTEAGSGLPINADGTTVPKLGRGSNYPLAARTGADGQFKLDLPQGTYNLLAQSWQGKLLPINGMKPVSIPYYSGTVSAHGRAAGIVVPSDAAQEVRLRPAGTGTVQLRFDSPNDDAYAVLSTAPPSLDPIFGFAGWIGEFMNHAIAVNRVPKGKADFLNMPTGSVYVAVFANDNLPGFGVSQVEIKDGLTTTVPLQFLAKWGNGRKTPPPELAGLYNKFVQHNWNADNFPTLPRVPAPELYGNPARVHEVLVKENPIIKLPDETEASARDVYTVLMYRALKQR